MDPLQQAIVDVIGRERWERLRAGALYPADQALARAAAECGDRHALAAVRVYQACGQRPPSDLVHAVAAERLARPDALAAIPEDPQPRRTCKRARRGAGPAGPDEQPETQQCCE